MSRTLGLDFGDSRTGVAISDIATGCIAQPVATICERNRQLLIDKILSIVKEQGVDKIVVGLPLKMDGSQGERAVKTLEFVGQLQKYCDFPIRTFDERLTSASAHHVLAQAGIPNKKRKGKVDTIAATLILQAFLEFQVK